MSTAIQAANVSVRYGRKTALEDVSLSVAPGSVYALLGRNGSGKSSLVRTLLGQLPPAQGRATLFGEDVWRHRTRLMERVGVVPEDADAPPEMRVRELAWFSSRLYPRWSQAAFDARIDRFGIDANARSGNLSKGQKKQVSLALALAASPELLILDDPTLGLDVVARKSLFEEVIADMADRGITVFITTHDLAPVEAIADRAAILKNGRIVLDEELETMKSRFRRIRFASQPLALAQANLIATAVRQWGTGTEAVVTNYNDLELARLQEAVPTVDVAPLSLEEIFIAVAGEEKGQQS
ncbi:MAG TPA: ABC transporter ATP-binding protein [Thermoanaerobaculia bacterium]|jgi:ABC-2 type transport system ATP-binding protein|nr:ABC transporter ATP-binding protein [Thermoanaerobaculia bacterium]